MSRAIKVLVVISFELYPTCRNKYGVSIDNLPKDLHEGEIPTRLNLPGLVAAWEFQILDGGLVERSLSWPFQSFSPGLVAEP